MDSKQEDIDFIAKGLAEFFKDDPSKITHWLMTQNPAFGFAAPATVMILGRAHKVAAVVKESIESNKR